MTNRGIGLAFESGCSWVQPILGSWLGLSTDIKDGLENAAVPSQVAKLERRQPVANLRVADRRQSFSAGSEKWKREIRSIRAVEHPIVSFW